MKTRLDLKAVIAIAEQQSLFTPGMSADDKSLLIEVLAIATKILGGTGADLRSLVMRTQPSFTEEMSVDDKANLILSHTKGAKKIIDRKQDTGS